MASALSDDETALLELQAARDATATRMIDVWIAAHAGRPAPWDVAVEIVCVISRLPDAEKARLLALKYLVDGEGV